MGQSHRISLHHRLAKGHEQGESSGAHVQANTKPRAASAATAKPVGAKRLAAPLDPCADPVAVEVTDAPVVVPAAEPETEPVIAAVGVAEDAG